MREKIIKGIGGLYYVCADGGQGLYECRARGTLRRDGRRPLAGDDVEFDSLDDGKLLGSLTALLPRRRELIRPAVANVSQALLIFSIVSPRPDFNLLDKLLIMMRQQDVPCVICFNKKDMDEGNEADGYLKIYGECGYRTLSVSAVTGEGIERLKELLAGNTTAVAGPSGVGKSSLVNCLQSGVVMETGQVSAKIQRGKHTTRHSELIAMGENTYIFDTPGFSSLGLFDLENEELAGYYPEFAEYERYCRFGGCSHVSEPVCGVKDALAEGKISGLRYGNYCQLYEELKGRRKY